MTATAFGMPLTILRDGVVATADGASRPLPLLRTTIDIEIRSGLAITKLARRFRNAEADPIEVLMTFPVGFHSAVTALSATIDGRTLVGRGQAKAQARETYEAALERGELAVLHEEPLRGLNVISIAPLPAGTEVEVCAEIVTPLSVAPGGAFLRLPITIGDVYGDSPLLPADDVLSERDLASPATLSIRSDVGTARLADGRCVPAEGVAIELNTAIEVTIEDGEFGAISGRAADGRSVELRLSPAPAADVALSCTILVDRSGSTSGGFSGASSSVWKAMLDGLAEAFSSLSEADEIALWQFDDQANLLGRARGPKAGLALLRQVGAPNGGTELIRAVSAAAKAGARQILVLTDGQTWATQAPAGLEACVSAVLVGSASLDAGIGHLAAQTGGEVFYAAGRETATAVCAGLAAMRAGSSCATGKIVDGMPLETACGRSGVLIAANWSSATGSGEVQSDAIGRFAASLALPLFTSDEKAAEFAAAHDLACHLTSLVLVDPLSTSIAGVPRTIRQPLALDALAHSSHASYSLGPSISRVEGLMRALRMPTIDDLPRPGQDLSRRMQKPKSLFARLMGAPDKSIASNAINWDLHATDFANNDLTSLPESLLAMLKGWTQEALVRELAQHTNMPVLLVALALYAEREYPRNRNAKRFVKKVLAGIDGKHIEEAMRLLAT